MSAICAVFRWSGAPVPAASVRLLLDRMDEYGPEARCWAPELPEAPVALGAIPFRVTREDEFHHRPLRSADDRLVVVADARIDNRDELAAELGISGDDARRMADAAFILAAYDRWGPRAPRHLLGDYAFVLWDAQRRELFCARDAMGQRVLFYHASPDGIELATTPHALAGLPHVRARLDLQKVADFLVLVQLPETTFFEGIRRIPPGHTLVAGTAGISVRRFWSPVPERTERYASDEAYVERFLELFGAAVQSQLRCAGTVGVMASGGLDSSSVAAVAAERLRGCGGVLPLFHAAPRVGFEGRVRRGYVADESSDVAAIARLHPNIAVHVRRNDDRSPFDDYDTSFRMTGAPPRNPGNSPWFYALYELARSAGVRVLLTGHKGNATISQTGLRSIRDGVLRGEWRRVWREVHAIARSNGEGRRSVVRREVVTPLTPAVVAHAVLKLTRRQPVSVAKETASAVNPEFARSMRLEERVRAANRDLLGLARLSDRRFRLAVLAAGADVFDLYSGYRPWFGIETRDPTADRRVVEFCMAIPGSQFLRDGVTRWLVRRAMEDRLPDEVRLRATTGAQGPDWTEWLPKIRPQLSAELDQLERSDTARRCLDLVWMRELLARWPARLTVADDQEYYLKLLRGITMGRFIRWFERTYE